jgi:ABC-type sugar transport system permease subunit
MTGRTHGTDTRLPGPMVMKARTSYLLLLPFFLFFCVFWVVPLLGGLQMSLYSNEIYGQARFVGLDHYKEILHDPRYGKAIRNTVLYTVCSIGLILPLALALAQWIQMAWARARSALTFMLLLPGLTPPAVLALLFLLVFHGRDGLLNQLFVLPLGAAPINWLKDPHFILPALVIQAVWRWTGFITFFILAGMEAIPRVLFEAAHLETNSRWKVFFRVTLPRLGPVLVFAGVYLVVDGFSLFSGAYVLLGGSGGTGDAGLLLVSYTYQNAFAFGKFGTAAAMSVLIAPFLLGLLWLCFLLSGRSRSGSRETREAAL